MPESRAPQTNPTSTPQAVGWWPDPRKTKLLLIGILALAFVLRLVYSLQMQANPYFSEPTMDALYHLEWARTFAAGETFRPGEPFFRGPLYPWFLGAVTRVFGDGLLAPRILQAGLGTATTGLCYMLGRDVFDRRVGLLAALLAATYWVMIYFDGELLITTLVVPINLLALWLSVRLGTSPSPRKALVTGLCWGISALARPQVLLLMPVLALWLMFRVYPNWRSGGLPTLALALGTALPIAPITAYNASVGDPVLIASSGGVNFWIGNNPQSDGSTAIVPGTRPGWWQGYRDAIALAEAAEGGKLKASEVSSHYVGKAWDHILESPGQALGHLLWKFRLFWSNWELGNNQPIYYFAHEFGWIVKILPLGFWAIAPLGLLGMLLCLLRRSPNTFALGAFVTVQAATIVCFFVCSRFRLPIVPVLMVFGAHAVFEIVGMVQNRSRARLMWSALLLIAAGLFVALVPAAVDRSAGSAMRQLGVFAQHKGQFKKALSFYNRALSYEDVPPRMKALLHKDLGTTFTKLNRLSSAERELKFAIELDPRQSEAMSALTTLYLERLGKPELALQTALTMTQAQPSYGIGYYNLGQCYVALKQMEGAIAAFESGLRVGGVDFECSFVIGQIQAERKQWKEATASFRRALASRKDLDSWYFAAAEYLVNTLLNSNNQRAARQFTNELASRAPGHPKTMQLQRLTRGR